MKMQLNVLLVLMVSSLWSYGQVKVRRVVNKTKHYPKSSEIYYIVKKGNHKGEKHGQYSLEGYGNSLSGTYYFDKKNGEWKVYDKFGNYSEYYSLGHLDSANGTKGKTSFKLHLDAKGDTLKYINIMPNGLLIDKVEDTTFVYKSFAKTIVGISVNDKKEGQWQWETPQGTAISNYKNGKMVGTQTSYYKNGSIMTAKNYNNEGNLHGLYYLLYHNGDTLLSQHYKNGKLHNTSQAWYTNKQLLYTSTYVDGRLVNYNEYEKDGTKNLLSSVTNGIGILIIKESFRMGEYPIKNGMIEGEVKTTNGDSIKFMRYKGGILQEKKPNLNDEIDELDTTYAQQEYRYLNPLFESKATFPKDETGLQRFLAENVRYPRMALDNDAQGTVIVVFTVDQLGNVIDISTINKKHGFGLEEEAMRVIRETAYMWTPATQDGFPVKMRFRIPIKFQIF